jgi:hypothetical protein
VVALSFIFAPENKAFQLAWLSCILVPKKLNVYLLAEFSYPFGGLIQIKPVMFEALRHQLFLQKDEPPEFLQPSPAVAQ